jgi:hypothetical protein
MLQENMFVGNTLPVFTLVRFITMVNRVLFVLSYHAVFVWFPIIF